jgi:hypothetical protein
MWKGDDAKVWGLSLDEDHQLVEWSDSIDCACGDSFATQSFANFLARGPRFGDPPEDVLAQVYESLSILTVPKA